MFVLAFIPMLLVAFAYKELSQDTPDCGTTFTWGTKAFGPWIGWIGGWGLAVSAIIVLANVAEIAAIYLFKFLGQDELADNLCAKVALGSFFIIAMTLVSARGVVVSERIQNVLIAIQFGVLIIVSIIALIRVFSGNAGAQAITPQLSWLWPCGLDFSSIAAAIILCIFIYWGWDACLAVGEETKNPGKTPGIAAVITTLILVCTYVLVAYAVAVLRRLRRRRHRPEQPDEHRRRADRARRTGGRPHPRIASAADSVGVGVVVDADHDPAHRARHAVDGRLRGPAQAVRQRAPEVHDAGVRHHRDGRGGAVLLPGADVPQRERARSTRWPRSAWPSRSTTASPRTPACGTSAGRCSSRPETCSSAASSRCWVPSR